GGQGRRSNPIASVRARASRLRPVAGHAFLLALVPRPDTGHLAGALGGATVDRRLDQAEDRALHRGGEQDLSPASVGIGSLGSIVFTEGDLLDLLEDGPGEHPPSTLTSIPVGLYSTLIIVSSTGRSLVSAR